jgi:hypothetical protein
MERVPILRRDLCVLRNLGNFLSVWQFCHAKPFKNLFFTRLITSKIEKYTNKFSQSNLRLISQQTPFFRQKQIKMPFVVIFSVWNIFGGFTLCET